ncbi:MAG: helix-turn-helix domain-containing protein [Candidatus Loosdrechtia sp.]|uniref:helix-turn-helix domain-containing protein n=1 Tax=Candidatus Loosdrechtia sp. TaxID=3101272 RepID=UPI003A69514C|nr:MAG: transposase family protein [Candidatus Jettenia sp. AMX2]
MLRFMKIYQKPHLLLQFTGMTLEQFTAFSEKLKLLWDKAEEERLTRRNRKHALGQGRRYKLDTMEDKVLFILVFRRFHPTDEVLGDIFGLHPSNACRMRTKIEPLLEKIADPFLFQTSKSGTSSGKKKISTREGILKVCPELAEFVVNPAE